ncbi:hypothetical protein AC629_20570 [Bradyrhizobium sp. NAS80.1]|nr:hypothetical protein AC629_20570 [Bradyrhizobium sp. NAS80.1]
MADPFATLNWCEVPEQPSIAIIPGEAAAWRAVLPTIVAPNVPFSLGIRADDAWGNPTGNVGGTVLVEAASGKIEGLPREVRIEGGARSALISNLTVSQPGEISVTVSRAGETLAVSNPARVQQGELRHAWADLHGQSGETIGTGTAREFAEFARDLAFLDAMCHQGNDFQITAEFWKALNELTAEMDETGRFVFIPGYEWSGNTALGGDRNVLYLHEGETIHRSSHALVGELADLETDAFDVAALFDKLRGREAIVLAHVGGRYADISGRFHDRALQRAVEVHSDWGTFEWLADDAFRDGLRVGIVANSDGHKGRHGASHPGASMFGAFGGLTCLLVPELSRAAVFDALRKRHHYATTGCRLYLDVGVELDAAGELHHEDPALGGKGVASTTSAKMGDIIVGGGKPTFRLTLSSASPIERVEFRNGSSILETYRPYASQPVGKRLRVLWEGAEYRGRGRQTIWDGHATVAGNTLTAIRPINRWNLDKRCELTSPECVEWTAVTTGGFGGFEADLSGTDGKLHIETPHGTADVDIGNVGFEPFVLDCGGLDRKVSVQRLPDDNDCWAIELTRSFERSSLGDTALWVKVVFEDGNAAWTSPVYLVPAS